VHDGSGWRRIDLGGAGRALREPLAEGVHHEPPPDPFAWPPNATRGDDLADRSRSGAPASSSGASSGGGGGARSNGGAPASAPDDSSSGASGPTNMSVNKDERPPTKLSVAIVDADAHRGAPLRVRGDVAAEGEACGHVVVALALRDARAGREVSLGTLATDGSGKYEGALVVPQTAPLGDYDVVARTLGDARCGPGGTR